LAPTPPPPSLNNMFKEAVADVGGFRKPTHGNLEAWSRQGVLLLNTVLTVRRGQAHSHKGKGWENFTDAVIKELDAKKTGLVFLLWGKPAQVCVCEVRGGSFWRAVVCCLFLESRLWVKAAIALVCVLCHCLRVFTLI
jgi:uracil-DNA glycosylase